MTPRRYGSPLRRSFFLQPTLEVARQLLGKVMVRDARGGRVSGRIVEVEAYRGPEDRAAHSHRGHRSRRNEAMYGPPGHAYVYMIYGVHHCVNAVCQPPGVPEAVLIRALEPLEGLELMARRRGLVLGGPATLDAGVVAKLCRGPGVLCRALDVDRQLNGADLTRGPLRILEAPSVPRRLVRSSARIGVAYAGKHAARRWRFFLAGHACVSGRSR